MIDMTKYSYHAREQVHFYFCSEAMLTEMAKALAASI